MKSLVGAIPGVGGALNTGIDYLEKNGDQIEKGLSAL